MTTPKETIVNGKPTHYSVGALIKKEDKYLLILREKPPLGFAGIGGHIDIGEEPLQALVREVEEECGLEIIQSKLLGEEMIDWNWCHRGVTGHYWYLYGCEATGAVKQNFAESKSIGWYTLDDIKKLDLEPVWKYWLEKIKLM